MERRRVLALGLDGLEITLAERLMAEGEMPALSELRRRAACFRLDHGSAQRTGLAWEHVASGLSPEAGRRWAAVEFDPATYDTWQEGARFPPWWAGLDRRVVVFDTPYTDLARAPRTRGIVGWGAHDPGTPLSASPRRLLPEFRRRIGNYPASPWTYGLPWPSATRAREMGEALCRAIAVRSEAARWLAAERLADWDLFLAVAGEIHGAVEGLWHGVDPNHPLHTHPSAAAAGRSLTDLHRAADRMVADLAAAAGDAAIVVFTMGGMGPNRSDVASMVLLPELLYRRAFGRPLLTVPAEWTAAPGSLPPLDQDERWSAASRRWVPASEEKREPFSSEVLSLARRLPGPIQGALKRVRDAVSTWKPAAAAAPRQELDWQPAQRYRTYWPRMPAFAIPSFYDGRIRVNLKGRERDGMVEPSLYDETLRELETLLLECRNPRTGEPVVEAFEHASTKNPLELAGSEADLQVIWRGVVAALEHPRLGLVGPVPLRRTGGHTGRHGMAYVAAPGVSPGDRGVRSAFDVVPTIGELLGVRRPAAMSGKCLF